MSDLRKYIVKTFLKGSYLFILLFVSACSADYEPAYLKSVENVRFSVVKWEFETFFSNIFDIYRLNLVDDTVQPSLSNLHEYEALTRRIVIERNELKKATILDSLNDTEKSEAEIAIENLIVRRERYKPAIELFIENEIVKTLKEEDFAVFPTPDIKLRSPPSSVVISPRETIERLSADLTEPDLPDLKRETIEREIALDGKSGIVLDVGGVATFPSIIHEDTSIRELLNTTAHEWLHTHLIFYPLGWSYFSDSKQVEINETLANRFGYEIGTLTYNRLFNDNLDPILPNPEIEKVDSNNNEAQLFNNFMFFLRQDVENLLSENKIDEAETTMEMARKEIANRFGINIRKLNQAYFAFYGDYGNTPASISEVPTLIWQLRQKSESVKEMIVAARRTNTLDELKELLNS